MFGSAVILILFGFFYPMFEGQIVIKQCLVGTLLGLLDSKRNSFTFHNTNIVAHRPFIVK